MGNALGITTPTVKLFNNEVEISQANVNAMLGKTLTTCPLTTHSFETISGTACPFVDVKFENNVGTLLLENPAGCDVTSYANEVLSTMFGVSLNSTKKFILGSDTFELNCMTHAQWKTLYGKS